jgi:hypothetical protein
MWISPLAGAETDAVASEKAESAVTRGGQYLLSEKRGLAFFRWNDLHLCI